MEPIVLTYHTGKLVYAFDPTLQAGYYNGLRGWHLYKSSGLLVYNVDENNKPFFNKK